MAVGDTTRALLVAIEEHVSAALGRRGPPKTALEMAEAVEAALPSLQLSSAVEVSVTANGVENGVDIVVALRMPERGEP